jgi:hypothetical protein
VSLTGADVPTFAQVGAKQPPTNSGAPVINKWRPKDGTYASPGKDFDNQCGEFGDFIIELTEKRISGNEWGCDVARITGTGPNAIRLDMTCNDYNLAETIHPKDPDSYSRKFNEFMLLEKRDENTVLVQKSSNGKLRGSRWRAAYCPDEAQRMYKEAKARDEAEAARKADEERRSKSDHPKGGVYALAGADFEQRCSKFGDAVIELNKEAISFGLDKCKIVDSSDQPPDTVRITVLCNGAPNGTTFVASSDGRRPIVEPSGREGMMLKKIDNNNVIFWREENGHFTGPGQQLSYCSQDVQHAYAKQSEKEVGK